MHKILVVDDEENMLALFRRVLGKEGYRIECVDSGKEALELAGETPFGLAIVDVSMPDMDGIEVLEKLKVMDSEMPVIMISAFPSWEKEQTARRLGCTDYLSKPLNMKSLKDLIRKNIKKK
ncbi:MAG: response regulator [Desulfobacterales bacterium]|nr:response regulator [Desulfobacterales bacterium]